MPRLAGILITLACGIAASAQVPSRDTGLAVWPWLVGDIDQTAAAIVQDAQAAGIDTIYLHLYRSTGSGIGILYAHDEAGAWNPAWGQLDPKVTLSAFVSLAHAVGIQVVGVIGCFLDGGPLPGDANHESVLADVVEYLVATYTSGGDAVYPLDGIALDRVRFYTGSANPPALVNGFILSIRARLHGLPLHAFIPANPWHIDGPTYDASFRGYAAAMSLLAGQYGHDWEQLAPLLDVMIPMAYVADGGVYGQNHAYMNAYTATVAAYARQAAVLAGVPTRRVLVAVRTWSDAQETTTVQSLSACITGALNGGADGFVPYRFFTIGTGRSLWGVIGARAAYGSDLPVANLTTTGVSGATATFDASGSVLPTAQPVATVAFDADDDGAAEVIAAGLGPTEVLLPGPGSRVVSVHVTDSAGRTAVRSRRISVPPALLIASGVALPTSAGGSVTLALNGGPAAAGMTYAVVGSASGASPGVSLGPGINLPIRVDALTAATLAFANTIYLPGFAGALDAGGGASAGIFLPAGLVPPGLSPSVWTFAGAALDGGGTPRFATNEVFVVLLP